MTPEEKLRDAAAEPARLVGYDHDCVDVSHAVECLSDARVDERRKAWRKWLASGWLQHVPDSPGGVIPCRHHGPPFDHDCTCGFAEERKLMEQEQKGTSDAR